MNVEEIREYCIAKKGVEESFPFGETTLVFKVQGKIFLLLALDAQPPQFNAKCAPDLAIQLRETYACVVPGYHMNKQHWNTIVCDGSAPKKLIFEWIDHSYTLVYDSLPKKLRIY
jgi:predicted DNA-binding protein (MmcQ/YjbR family)